jgi:hypothetical protein
MNLEFLKRRNLYKNQNPAFFTDPEWPTALAAECAESIAGAEAQQRQRAQLRDVEEQMKQSGEEADLRIVQILKNGLLASRFSSDLIFVYCGTQGKADGDGIHVTLYPVGTLSYTTALGSSKTVHAFAISPEDAIRFISSHQ